MTFHFFLLLLLFCLMLSLARLCRLSWCHHGPAQLRAAARRTPIRRLLKPRSPHDCPACRLSSTLSSVVEPAPPAVRPWREVKSRRGAPKRVNTEGFACGRYAFFIRRSTGTRTLATRRSVRGDSASDTMTGSHATFRSCASGRSMLWMLHFQQNR
jgi:hypothetical protein